MDKAFDRVSRDVIWWVLRRLGVGEWLVKIVQSMYRKVRSFVRVHGTFSNNFLVQVGLHQGTMLSPLLFTIVPEALSREIRLACSEEMLYADDLVLVRNTRRPEKDTRSL